jgi:putative serine protease PepD
MSEHDSSWAPDDRVAGPLPRQEQERRADSTPADSSQPTGSAAGTPAETPPRPAETPTSPAETPISPAQAPTSPSETPTTSFPTASYHAGSYAGGGTFAAGQTGAQPTFPSASYPSPYHHAPGSYQTSAPPYPGSPYQGPTEPGAPYPGAPAWQPAGAYHDPRPNSGHRVTRGIGIAAAVVAIALFSGVTGGFVAHQVDGGGSTTTITRNAAPVVDRASVAAVAAKVQPSVVDITTGAGEGSGVVISADGAILTNNHVLEGARGDTVDVTFNDGRTAKATVVGTDPTGDLAVVKAQNVSGLTPATFGDSDSMQVGDSVLALGSPLGLQGSVTAGIVSALHRTIDEGGDQGGGAQGGAQRSIGDALQTDAAINPGNSGGALVNLAGEVIGINTAIATSGQGANGNIGVGFAISSNRAKATADQLLKGGKVSHPYLGVQVANGDSGALIADVVSGGPADKAGLKKGDLITKIGSRTISDSNSLVSAVQAGKPGDRLQLTIVRDNAQQQLTVTLGEQP